MKLLIACGASAVLLVAASSALAETGNGSVTVVRPLAVAKNADLRFGTIVRPGAGQTGSIAVSTAGSPTYTNVTNVASGGGQGAAQFTVTGEGGQSISVTVDSSFQLSGPGGAILTVTTSNDAPGAQSLSGSIGADGTKVVNVGGSVPITDTTATGAYTGAFNVTASYN